MANRFKLPANLPKCLMGLSRELTAIFLRVIRRLISIFEWILGVVLSLPGRIIALLKWGTRNLMIILEWIIKALCGLLRRLLQKLLDYSFKVLENFQWGFVIILTSLISAYFILSIAEELPSMLIVSLPAISASLGGLTLTAASLFKKSSENGIGKEYIDLISVAKKLIFATVLLLIFYFSFSWTYVNPVEWRKFDLSLDGFVRGLIFWISSLSLVLGSLQLSDGLVSLSVFLLRLGESKSTIRK